MGKESIRILHIDSEKGWRGGQQQVVYLLESMYKSGYLTELICQPNSEIQKYCEENSLPYRSFRMYGEVDFIAGFKISLYCRQKKFNILHSHSAHTLAIGLWAKIFYSKLKLIAVRRVDFHIKRHWFSQLKYRTKLLNKIVCISNGIKNVLIEDGIPADKIVTIHSGIDVHKFDDVLPEKNLRQKFGIHEDHVLVGTIAAMVGHKDYPNLLKAAKIVIEKEDNVTFCALGDGPNKSEILELAHKLQLGKRFIFAGFQRDIRQFLKSFDIFVLASHLEGLGTSLLDAQAVGLPIVACDTGGISEAVSHEKNGLLVPPKNEEALAKAILILVNDKELRKKFGVHSLETVKIFDIRNTLDKNIQLYHQL